MRIMKSLTRSRRPDRDTVEGDHVSYFRHPEALEGRHRLTLLRGGGEAFPAMLAAIRGARRRVLLETYILRSDWVGEQFADALGERARAGVTCRVIFDSLGSFGISAQFLRRLTAAGVSFIEYAPIAPWRQRWGITRRDHQKILVVDDEVAFVGGINIGAEYAPGQEDEGWIDLHASIEGSVVGDLARLFRRTWVKAGGAPFRNPVVDPVIEDESFTARVQVIDNNSLLKRGRMNLSYRHAIRAARHSVDIMNAYFIPVRGLRRVLSHAARRGVEVRVLVPGVSDIAVVQYASRYLYKRMLKQGLRIFEFPERMMHAKVAVIDGVWSTIGSYNLDVRSLFHNLEAGALVLDEPFAAELKTEFDDLIEVSREVLLDEWRQRPWWNLVLEWVSFRFRYWL